tara:strand:+ start:1443 stop:3260 length:1818 start_codon:yes stop_codon:yes gene_type:complete
MSKLDKKYILEALKRGIEREERLEEAEAIYSDIPDKNKIKDRSKTYTNKDDLNKNHPNFTGAKAYAVTNIYKAIKSVADNADAVKQLRDGDFIKAGFIGGNEIDNVKKLQKYFNQKAIDASNALVKYGQEVKIATDAIDPDARAEAFEFVTKQMEDSAMESVEDFLANLQTHPELGKYYQNLTAGGDVSNVFGQTDVLSQVQTISRFARDASGDVDFTRFEPDSFFVRAKSHILETFKNVKPLKSPPGVDEPTGANASTVIGGFRILQQFGKIVEFSTEDQSKFTAYIKSLTTPEKFQFMNNAAAYLSFADMARSLSGTVSGEALEKYLAVMFNMPVGGGSSGAADNLGKIVGGGIAYLSAKMYTDDSIYGVSQARGGDEGVDKLIGDSGRQLIYINVQKKSGEQNYELLRVFVTRVYKPTTDGAYLVELLDDQGTVVGKPEPASIADTKSGSDRVKVMISDRSLSPTFEIPAPMTVDKDKLLSTSKLLDYTTNMTGDQLIKDLKSVIARAQQLTDSMSGYRAAKAGGDKSTEKVKDEIVSISDEYQNIYTEIQRIFTSASTDEEDKLDTSAAEQGTVFAKGKKQTFAETIREMIENELKDIDFE